MEPDSDDINLDKLVVMARYALEKGCYADAEMIASAVLEQTYGVSSPEMMELDAKARYALARVSEHNGDHIAAYSLVEKALQEINRADPSNEAGNRAIMTSYLGQLAHKLGRPGEAISLQKDALRHLTSKNTPDQEASILNNLALILYELGDYANARSLLKRANGLLDKTASPANLEGIWLRAVVLRLLGYCEWYLTGNPMSGLEDTWKALKLTEQYFPDRPDRVCVVLHALAFRVSLLEGMYHALKDTIPISFDDGDANEFTRRMAAVGIHYDKQFVDWLCSFRPSQAEQMFLRASVLAKGAYPPDNPLHYQPLLDHAKFKMRMGDYAGADALYSEAIDLQGRHPNELSRRLMSSIFTDLTGCLVAQGKYSEALKLSEILLKRDEDVIASAFLSSSEAQRLEVAGNLRSHLNWHMWLVWRYFSDDQGAIRRTFELLLRRKGLASTASLLGKEVLLDHRKPRLSMAFDRLAELRRLIARSEIDRATGGEPPQDSDQNGWLHEVQELEVELARETPEIAGDDFKCRIISLDNLVTILGEDSVLIECVHLRSWDVDPSPFESMRKGRYSPPGERYLGFVVSGRPGQEVRLIDFGDAGELDGLISAYLDDVRGKPADEVIASNAGKALSSNILKQALDCASGCSRVCFAPDGQLALLPIEALPYGNGFAIDRYEIRYLSFGRDLIRYADEQNTTASKSVIVCDPDYDLRKLWDSRSWWPSRQPFRRLPATRREGRSIEKLLRKGGSDVEYIGGARATKTMVMSVFRPYLLHVATHGAFIDGTGSGLSAASKDKKSDFFSSLDSSSPFLRSFLVLAGANRFIGGKEASNDAGNGLLTAEEAATMDLYGTRLVVLSACDTGRGKAMSGEGVFGLRRAFETAGARSVVISLWRVWDDETMVLMKRFYQYLLAGDTQVAALRKAKLDSKNHGANPDVWASFICVGDSIPLFSKAPISFD